MNKNKGIWIVIIGILVIGILVTVMTVSFVGRRESVSRVHDQSETSNMEEQAAIHFDEEAEPFTSQLPVSSPMAPDQEEPLLNRNEEPEMLAAEPEAGVLIAQPGIETENDLAKAAPAQEEALDQAAVAATPADLAESAPVQPQLVMEDEAAAKVAEPLITPLSPNLKSYTTIVETIDMASYYQKHIAELDGQIKKMREESADSNTYSMKALADKELRLWSRELNDIFALVSDCLELEEREELEISQQKWIKERDSKAQAAGKKYSGGSLEGVEHTASLADSTRSRAYDLVAEYEDLLSEEKTQ